MGAFRTEVIRSNGALAAVTPAWWSLWRRSTTATPFQSPAWLVPWWCCFAPDELLTVALWRGDDLVALAPMYVENNRYGRRILPLGISASDYFDILIDPAVPTAGERVLDAVHERAAPWDSWELEQLPPNANALCFPDVPGLESDISPQSACPVLPLPASLDALATAVPGRKLRKLRMARSRAARRAGFVVRSIGPQDAPAFLVDLFRLHGSRWEEQGEAGVLADESVRRFHADALPALSGAGLARAYTLIIEGHVVGAYYGFSDGRRSYAYLSGFDPSFAFESPGTILVGHAIEEAVREGCSEFHFLRGQESYKYQWGAIDRWNQRRSIRCAEPRRTHA